LCCCECIWCTWCECSIGEGGHSAAAGFDLGVVGTAVALVAVVPVAVLAEDEPDAEAAAEAAIANCGNGIAVAAALAEGSVTALGSASGAADSGRLFADVVGEVGVVGVVGVGVDGVAVFGVWLTVTVSCRSKSPLWCNM